MNAEWPEMPARGTPVVNDDLRRLAWLIGGSAAEEWCQGDRYQYRPNPAVREALEIISKLDREIPR